MAVVLGAAAVAVRGGEWSCVWGGVWFGSATVRWWCEAAALALPGGPHGNPGRQRRLSESIEGSEPSTGAERLPTRRHARHGRGRHAGTRGGRKARASAAALEPCAVAGPGLTLESTERVVRARSGAVGAKADTLMAHARATRTEANFMVKVERTGLSNTRITRPQVACTSSAKVIASGFHASRVDGTRQVIDVTFSLGGLLS